MRFILAASALAVIASPAAADVVSSGPNQFHIRHEVAIEGNAAEAFALLQEPGKWWSGAHSYSGDAANFSMGLTPGGCFCEVWDGGFVKHLEIVSMMPNRQIVMEGGLGPLRFSPASGTMVWDVADGKLVVDYKVTGFAAGDGEQWAGAVDGVIGEQVTRFAAALAAD